MTGDEVGSTTTTTNLHSNAPTGQRFTAQHSKVLPVVACQVFVSVIGKVQTPGCFCKVLTLVVLVKFGVRASQVL